MGDNKSEELKTRSIRADDDTYEKFRALASNEFGNQGQCLETLINLYEIENSKASLVERKFEIENFQDYLNKIANLFITSLQLNSDAEARIRGEFARQLELKENSLLDLQEKLKSFIEADKKNKKDAEDLVNKNKELTKINLALEKDKATLEELVNKNDEILSKNKDEINTLAALVSEFESYKSENVTLKLSINEQKQQISDLNNELKMKDSDIKNRDKEINKLENQINDLKSELKDEKSLNIKLRESHKSELIELENKYEEKLSVERTTNAKLVEVHKTELEDLKNRNDEKLEEIKSKADEKLEVEKAAKTKLIEDHKLELEKLKSKNDEKLNQEREAINKLREDHKTEINDLEKKYENKLKEENSLMQLNFEERLNLEKKSIESVVKSLENEVLSKDKIISILEKAQNKKAEKTPKPNANNKKDQ